MTSNNEAQVVLLKMIHGNEIITKLLNKDELHYRISSRSRNEDHK
jgi:nanoRNase/pAp phosphatase (c-di-AMP/oligoRNAs hydrolase)